MTKSRMKLIKLLIKLILATSIISFGSYIFYKENHKVKYVTKINSNKIYNIEYE